MPQIIFTKHALDRLKSRRLAKSDIAKVLKNPKKTFPGKKEGTFKFIRTLDERRIHVIGKYLEEEKKWLVVSVWVRGEEDRNWVMSLFGLVYKALKFVFNQLRKMVLG